MLTRVARAHGSNDAELHTAGAWSPFMWSLMTVRPGTRVGGYEIVALIGAGGMGEVYRARDTKLHRDVAFKVLPELDAAEPEALARFRREAQVLAALNHPNIAIIHELVEKTELNALVLEFVEGQTLAERIVQGPVPPAEALAISKQIAEALDAAHEHGVIHRDPKPANVKIRPDGIVKVLDFGIAKLTTRDEQDHGGTVSVSATPTSSTTTKVVSEPRTLSGSILGTMAYMSPEQAEGRAVDARSDVFSLGCVLYEMVTGTRAFGRDSVAGTLAAVLRDEPGFEAVRRAAPALDGVIFRCLRKDPALRFDSMQEVKAALHSLPGRTAPADGRPRSGPSIAVLPFANLTPDKEGEYFAEGLAEDVISILATFQGLRVVARTSAFACGSTEADIRRIGRLLSAGFVLTGSVRLSANRIRVTAQLVSTTDGSHLWAERYDREIQDVFQIQDEISQAIVAKLKVPLFGGGPVTQREPQWQAYTAYLKGRFHWNRRTPDDLRKAIAHFEQAIGSDPDYAAAYCGLADSYAVLGLFGQLPPTVIRGRAIDAAQMSVVLGPALAEAHASLGTVQTLYEWDWAAAETRFQQALELDPNSSLVRYGFSRLLTCLGRLDEATAHMRRALQLDPLSLMIASAVGYELIVAGRHDDAAQELQNALAMDAGFVWAHHFLGWAYQQRNDFDAAVTEFEQAVSSAASGTAQLGELGCAYALAGRREDARAILGQLGGTARQRYVPPIDIARVYDGLGDRENALLWLNRALEDRSVMLLMHKPRHFFRTIDPEPLLEHVGRGG
jgi:eukaryotic-like serine/threonine-protein kinase